MKKLLTTLLTILMLFTLIGCNSNKGIEEKPVIVDTPPELQEVDIQEEPIVGSYIEVEDKTITPELNGIFTTAMQGLLGASYEPLELVATQVVSGTNYKFLVKGSKTTNPITIGTYYIYINEDLNGNISLLDIEVIEEKQEEIKQDNKTGNIEDLYFWVVVYDQFDNELSRTTAKYGTIVKDPNGNDVKVKTNTYFHTYVDYGNTSSNNPTPPSEETGTSYYVTFIVGDSEYYKSQFDVGSIIVVPQTNPTQDNFTFEGWCIDKECKIPFVPSQFTLTQDTFIYAKSKLIESLPNLTVNGYELINDNTEVRIKSVSIPGGTTTLILPDYIEIGGVDYPVTEIAGVASDTSAGIIPIGSSSVTKIVIPSTYKIIGKNAFRSLSGKSNVNEIEFLAGSNLKRIEKNAFRNTSCTNISIPESTEYIGEYALFSNDMQTVNLPSTLKTIYANNFTSGCTNLVSITFAKPNNWGVFSGDTQNTTINFANPANNVTLFTSTYSGKCFKKLEDVDSCVKTTRIYKILSKRDADLYDVEYFDYDASAYKDGEFAFNNTLIENLEEEKYYHKVSDTEYVKCENVGSHNLTSLTCKKINLTINGSENCIINNELSLVNRKMPTGSTYSIMKMGPMTCIITVTYSGKSAGTIISSKSDYKISSVTVNGETTTDGTITSDTEIVVNVIADE